MPSWNDHAWRRDPLIGSIQTDLVLLRTLRSGDRAEFVRMHEISREHFGPWMPTYPTYYGSPHLADYPLMN